MKKCLRASTPRAREVVRGTKMSPARNGSARGTIRARAVEQCPRRGGEPVVKRLQPSDVCPRERFQHRSKLPNRERLLSRRQPHAKFTKFMHFVVIVKPLHDCRSAVLTHACGRARMVQEPGNRLSKRCRIARPEEEAAAHVLEKGTHWRKIACYYW